MKTIAVLTDFSTKAERAAMYAIHLAQKIGANVVLYNLCPLPVQMQMTTSPGYPDNPPEDNSEICDNLHLLSDRLKVRMKDENFPGAMLPEITFDTLGTHEIVDVMTSLGDRVNLILIVTSPGLNDTIEAYIQGGICRRIVDWATVPILVVPDSALIRNPEKIAFVSELAEKDAAYINLLLAIVGPYLPEIMIASMENHEYLVGCEKRLASKILDNVDYGRIYHRNIPVGKQKEWQWLRDNKNTDILIIAQRSPQAMKEFFERGICSFHVTYHITIPILILPVLL